MLENPVSSLQTGRIKTDVSLLNIATRKKGKKTMSACEGSCGVGLRYRVIILASVKGRGAVS